MIESSKSSIPSSLASSLEPILRKQTNNRLDNIHWFRTDWQRGGAATAFASLYSLITVCKLYMCI